MKRKRLLNPERPVYIGNVTSFGQCWKSWWSTLQPSWRCIHSTWPLVRNDSVNETWPAVKQSGSNGIFLAIICLSWWAHACRYDADTPDSLGLREAIDDVAYVLRCIIRSLKCRELVVRKIGVKSKSSPNIDVSERPSKISRTDAMSKPKVPNKASAGAARPVAPDGTAYRFGPAGVTKNKKYKASMQK